MGALGSRLRSDLNYGEDDQACVAVARRLWELHAGGGQGAVLRPDRARNFITDLARLSVGRTRDAKPRMLVDEIIQRHGIRGLTKVEVFGESKGGGAGSRSDPSARKAAKHAFRRGDYVKLGGMKKMSELNGMHGSILGRNTDGTFNLRLAGDSRRTLRVREKFMSWMFPLYAELRVLRVREPRCGVVSMGPVCFYNDEERIDPTVEPIVAVCPSNPSANIAGAVAGSPEFRDKVSFSAAKSTGDCKGMGCSIIFRFPPGLELLSSYHFTTPRSTRKRDPVAWRLSALRAEDGTWALLDVRSLAGRKVPLRRNCPYEHCTMVRPHLARFLGLDARMGPSLGDAQVWVPTRPPVLTRQTSYQAVRLFDEQLQNEHSRAEVAISLFKKPFHELAVSQKLGLFVKRGSASRGGAVKSRVETMYLQSCLHPAVLSLPPWCVAHIVEYSGLSLAKLNTHKRAEDLLREATRAVRDKGFAPQVLLEQAVRQRLRPVFGDHRAAIPRVDDKDVGDGKDGADGKGCDGSRPGASSNGVASSSSLDDACMGASYIELQIVVSALEKYCMQVLGSNLMGKEAEFVSEMSQDELKRYVQRQEAAKSSQGAAQGYSGEADEGAKVGAMMQRQKMDQKSKDKLTALLVAALGISVSATRRSNRLVASHYSLLRDSALNPILAYFLRNSIAQVLDRKLLYTQLLRLLEVFGCGEEELAAILLGGRDKGPEYKNVTPLLQALKKQTSLMARTAVETAKDRNSGDKFNSMHVATEAEFAAEMNRILSAALLNLTAVEERIESRERKRGGGKRLRHAMGDRKMSRVQERLKDISCGICPILRRSRVAHRFRSKLASSSVDRKLSSRLTREVATMMAGLPPGIFLRVDESRMDVMRALIIGPRGSPYENGCFFFDIFIPSNYPKSPPKMLIVTTGRGTFRFNANLYTQGKVCLSLLGTWPGPGWDARYSTLLQVFLSIQAMILGVEEPIANEPGWEKDVGSDRSRKYNGILQHGTMKYAMLEYLKNESSIPVGFEEIVATHFWSARDHMLSHQLNSWAEQGVGGSSSSQGPYGGENTISSEVRETVGPLRELLEGLEAPRGLQDQDHTEGYRETDGETRGDGEVSSDDDDF